MPGQVIFKLVNDRDGHAAGDDILRFVGASLPSVIPPGASVGRLGGDEFAVLLPGCGAASAALTATMIRTTLAPRIGVSIGGATVSPGDAIDADALVRTADVAMYAEKRSACRVATSRGTGAADPSGAAAAVVRAEARAEDLPADPFLPARERRTASVRPPVSLRAVVEREVERIAETPEQEAAATHWMNIGGTVVIVLSGFALAIAQLGHPGETVYDQILEWGLIPWALANVTVLVITLRFDCTERFARAWTVAYGLTAALLGLALCAAMLAGPGTGIAGPLAGAFSLKVIYDQFAYGKVDARVSTVAVLVCWAVAALVGPPSALWVVPFQAAVFVACWALGGVARRAHQDLTDNVLRIASSDPLTGLRNRAGYETDLERAIEEAPRTGGVLLVLGLDLDDFKTVNDTRGHEAGDRLLCSVAETLRATLPGACSIARIGGDEFVAALVVAGEDEADEIVASVERRLEAVAAASVGYARLGTDGLDAGTLTRAADARAYAAKRHRRGLVTSGSPAAA